MTEWIVGSVLFASWGFLFVIAIRSSRERNKAKSSLNETQQQLTKAQQQNQQLESAFSLAQASLLETQQQLIEAQQQNLQLESAYDLVQASRRVTEQQLAQLALMLEKPLDPDNILVSGPIGISEREWIRQNTPKS